jgi:hypothetical protein
MTRQVRLLVAAISCMMAVACVSSRSTVHTSHLGQHRTIDDSKTYRSVAQLLADTQLMAMGDVQAVRLDPSAPPSQPASLVTFDVENVIRGQNTKEVVVWQPADSARQSVQVPLVVGQTYLLCLALDTATGLFYIVGGSTGEFTWDPKTQTFSRLDPAATWEPSQFPLSMAEAGAGLYPEGGTTIPPTTNTMPPLAGACPPGCSLPSNYDAITVLASSAEGVEIITARLVRQSPGAQPSLAFTLDQVLEWTVPTLTPSAPDVSWLQTRLPKLTIQPGRSYVLIGSTNRGAGCLSALLAYDPVHGLVTRLKGIEPAQIQSTRVLPIPDSLTLAQFRKRMYPTTGIVYSSGLVEWDCPDDSAHVRTRGRQPEIGEGHRAAEPVTPTHVANPT